MADLWNLYSMATPVTDTAPASLVDISQAQTGTSVIRVYRVWRFDNRTDTAAGTAMVRYTIARIGGRLLPASLRPIPARKSSLLPDAITCGVRRLGPVSGGTIFRSFVQAQNDWAVDSNEINNWETDVPYTLVWNAGYADAGIQPLTARAGQAVHVQQETAAGTGVWYEDWQFEFTVAST